ncbi:tyrosine-type recombinase/integrase [Duganella rivi]|nr:tyrosine-type recombinase/integrase [Duganella rivi]
MYRGIRCRERIPLKPTSANLKRAEQHRSAILHAIATNSFDYAATFPESKNAAKFAGQPGDVRTVESYLDAWLDRQKKQLKASTYNGYRKIVVGYLVPWFGTLKLSALQKKDVRDKLEPLEASNKTLANIQSVLRAALTEAADIDQLIETNPMAGWSYSKVEPPKETDDIDPFTRDEQLAILKAADGQGKNLIQFAFWTGMRTSELVALDWKDVDFIRAVVRVSKAMTQHATSVETTKTVAGRREIKLLGGALEALQNQKQYTYLAGQEIFQNPQTGERWAGDQPIRKTLWQWVVKKAGVRYRYPYQTRHTYASMMLSAGEHPMWVAKQMGHRDWTMIARRYGRWMPDADAQAGSRAEALYGTHQLPVLQNSMDKH